VRFSFHRGSLALDLAGTVGGRASDAPEERLPDPAALSTWLAEAGLLQGAAVGAADLSRAVALREAVFRAAAAILDGALPRRADLSAINQAARGLRRGAPQLGPSLAVRWESEDPVQLALARVAADAIELLSSQRERLARCELPGCGALLLSRSRGEPRRWCSMETCGNRAKAAAFRARARLREPERRRRG
jgi:predicted RNA-binding Zn ribbon-like protein